MYWQIKMIRKRIVTCIVTPNEVWVGRASVSVNSEIIPYNEIGVGYNSD